jgi:hypothetical protein
MLLADRDQVVDDEPTCCRRDDQPEVPGQEAAKRLSSSLLACASRRALIAPSLMAFESSKRRLVWMLFWSSTGQRLPKIAPLVPDK